MVRFFPFARPRSRSDDPCSQAHVCISNTSRAGAELGYDVSVLSDGIGDRDIPGASAKQLVDVSRLARSPLDICIWCGTVLIRLRMV